MLNSRILNEKKSKREEFVLLKGIFHKTAKGHESYEIEPLEAEHIFPVATFIQEKYGFEAQGLPIFGFDSCFLELEHEGMKIMVGWDNWSGLYIMAYDEKGDAYIREIGRYLHALSENE